MSTAPLPAAMLDKPSLRARLVRHVLLPLALGSMAIFMLMAMILAWRPRGLFTVHG